MYQINNEKFGYFISELRTEKSMTQKDLADKLFVSDKTVSKWECGNSMPNITLLIPIAEVFGITVTELLRGEKNRKDININEEENIVNSLEVNLLNTIRERKKIWLFIYVISVLIVLSEIVLLFVSGITASKVIDSLFVSFIFLIFAGWVCVFAKELLPTYYDANKINFVSQGVFRINMLGLSFNNGNWPYILILFRVFTLSSIFLLSIVSYFTIIFAGITVWFNIQKIISIRLMVILVVCTYFIGKKYE